MFNEELLSIEELESFENMASVRGHYNDNYFVLDITDTDFYLGYDDTKCKDEEIENIYNYIMKKGFSTLRNELD